MAYQFIDPSECVGDSLYKINNNADNFDQRIIALTNTIATLSSALVAADSALTLAVSAAAPIGSVQTFAMASAPTGWLECNGVTVPNGSGTVQGQTANFAPLYAAVASTYGALGKLPDLRGEFVRGWDNSRGIDSGRTFGSSQADGIRDHGHAIRYASPGVAGGGGAVNTLDGSGPFTYGPGMIAGSASADTRPRNVSLLYCIKY